MRTTFCFTLMHLLSCIFAIGCGQNREPSEINYSESKQIITYTSNERPFDDSIAELKPGYEDYNSTDTVTSGNLKAVVDADHSTTVDGFRVSISIVKDDKVLQKINETLDGTYSYSELIDFSNDGYPDLILHANARGSGNFDLSRFYKLSDHSYVIVDAFKDPENPAFEKYERGEIFYTDSGKLYLEFQLFNDSDAGCCPTTGLMRIIEYKYDGRHLIPASFKDIVDTSMLSKVPND